MSCLWQVSKAGQSLCISCRTFTARFALTNYKAGVNTTKCPPAHAAIEEETGLVEDSCIIPSKIDDIINIAGFLREATATISVVLSWCQNHKISSCDFLFFALNRLITREARQLEESVQQVFKLFLKQKAITDTSMTALEGLALKIDLHIQY